MCGPCSCSSFLALSRVVKTDGLSYEVLSCASNGHGEHLSVSKVYSKSFGTSCACQFFAYVFLYKRLSDNACLCSMACACSFSRSKCEIGGNQ